MLPTRLMWINTVRVSRAFGGFSGLHLFFNGESSTYFTHSQLTVQQKGKNIIIGDKVKLVKAWFKFNCN